MSLLQLATRFGVVACLVSLSALPATAECWVNEIFALNPGDPTTETEVVIQAVGFCSALAQPQFEYYRKDGRTTQIFLRQPEGGILVPGEWSGIYEIGRLPAGTNTIEVYFLQADDTPLLMASTELEVAGPSCRVGRQAGATLLFPYVEVDLDDAGSLTTLVSVINASTQPVLARAVLWSDWSVPLLAFDLYLDAHAVVPVNLRDILVDGRLPSTGDSLSTDTFPGCTVPLTQPVLGSAELATLRSRMTGQPDPETGACFSSDRGETSRAVGFLTVDVLNQCSDEVRYPIEPGYFVAGGSGVGGNLNALWGDFVLVDPNNDSAAGFEALPIAADATRDSVDGQLIGGRFYPGQVSDRPLLGSTHQSRFLRGGAFDGGTELLVWMDGFGKVGTGGFTCGASPLPETFLGYRANGESGGLTPANVLQNLPACVLRLGIGDPALNIEQNAGLIEVDTYFFSSLPGVPIAGGVPSVVLSMLSAEGRFSVGYGATPVGDLCR